MNALNKMFEQTSQDMEANLRSRGETFISGNPDFDALVDQIHQNRIDREYYENCMSETLNGAVAVREGFPLSTGKGGFDSRQRRQLPSLD